MFGRKRIAQLEESLADRERIFNIQQAGWRESNERAAALQNQVEYLVRTIRDIDEQIFKMSQCNDWTGMRPSFANLSEGMMVRKRQESDRIGEVLRPELIKTYNNQKRLK